MRFVWSWVILSVIFIYLDMALAQPACAVNREIDLVTARSTRTQHAHAQHARRAGLARPSRSRTARANAAASQPRIVLYCGARPSLVGQLRSHVPPVSHHGYLARAILSNLVIPPNSAFTAVALGVCR